MIIKMTRAYSMPGDKQEMHTIFLLQNSITEDLLGDLYRHKMTVLK
jgi:hypothetical protein